MQFELINGFYFFKLKDQSELIIQRVYNSLWKNYSKLWNMQSKFKGKSFQLHVMQCTGRGKFITSRNLSEKLFPCQN